MVVALGCHLVLNSEAIKLTETGLLVQMGIHSSGRMDMLQFQVDTNWLDLVGIDQPALFAMVNIVKFVSVDSDHPESHSTDH